MEIKVIQNEYFKLIANLNRSNKIKNEKTKLSFQIESAATGQGVQLCAVLTFGSKIIITSKALEGPWIETGYTGLYNLEEYIVQILNENSDVDKNDYTELILLKLFPKE